MRVYQQEAVRCIPVTLRVQKCRTGPPESLFITIVSHLVGHTAQPCGHTERWLAAVDCVRLAGRE